MARTIQLLLTETVDNLGIVGDVVSVRTGYARNFLLPNAMATEPTEERIQALAAKRAEAERHQREVRQQREVMIQKIEGVEVTLQRSCNDQGQLYGSITQQDIASALAEQGFNVKPREIRLSQTIKRIDSYHLTVKVDTDLEAEIKLWVVADRELDTGRGGGHAEAAPAAEGAPADGAPAAQPQQRERRMRDLPDALAFDDDEEKPRRGKGGKGGKGVKSRR
jgi:large subunit ribosomal protein L9